jgi:YD repeat-containing protein
MRGQLVTATMVRGGNTQVRAFNYNMATGRLTSVTMPETGTTSYTYNSDGTVQYTLDAKNQRTNFTYDSLKRLKTIRRHTWSGSSYVLQPCQNVDYTYDSGSGSNLWGRLARVDSKICDDIVFTGYSEVYSYQTSGQVAWKEARWQQQWGSDIVQRVEATYNGMGMMTNYAYGTPGSLYSYLISYDGAYRSVNLTGEGLALVDLVQYNAAGGITSFERRDATPGVVTNTYQYNSLYQMTNQTVVRGSTTLQNLTYTLSTTQNNGQLLSQTDALSGETVEYQYDALNRLLTAQTPGGGGWGLSFSYDGFGNRTNQTVTKGSGPTHSVTINPANNRVSTSGYVYDANGNLTQMPLVTMVYDVANRMVESNHSSAGTQRYSYNHANQRILKRSGTGVTTICTA